MRIGEKVEAERILRDGRSTEWKMKASLNSVLGCTFALTRYVFGNEISQSDLSEDLGFNRRLLSKYELGTSNISYSTYMYIFQCLRVDSYISEKILGTVVQQLAQQGVYVYLNLDNVSLANNDVSTLEKPYVFNSYQYVMDWFGLQYDIKIQLDEFKQLDEIENKPLFELTKNIFKSNVFEKIRRDHRNSQKQQHIEKLEKELEKIQSKYIKFTLSDDGLLKTLDEEEKGKINCRLERRRQIKNELDSLQRAMIGRMRVRNLDNGDDYNKRGFDNFDPQE